MSEFMLTNAYEDLVKRTVRDLMSTRNMCQCEKCFLDACAIVMNDGFVCFSTSKQGCLLAQVPQMAHENHVNLVVSATKALEIVQAHPKHGVPLAN